MNYTVNILAIVGVLIMSGCASTLKSGKAGNDSSYTEDLTNYLPPDPIDSVSVEQPVVAANEIDSSLIITDRLDSVLALVNTYKANNTSYIEGLTIQLYSGSDRSEAKEVQLRVYRYFPDRKPKIIFDQPNYKVRMEKFYSQLEAYPEFKEVQAKFPKAILVPTRIPVYHN